MTRPGFAISQPSPNYPTSLLVYPRTVPDTFKKAIASAPQLVTISASFVSLGGRRVANKHGQGGKTAAEQTSQHQVGFHRKGQRLSIRIRSSSSIRKRKRSNRGSTTSNIDSSSNKSSSSLRQQ